MMSAKRWLFGLLCGGAFAVLGASTVLAADTSAVSTSGAVIAAAPAGDEAASPVYAARGTDTCLKCHDKGKDIEILRTAHAVKGDSRTPLADANQGCETCHGASPDHVASHPAKGEKRAAPAIVFNGPERSSAEAINKVCLTCHENNARIDWQGSKHQVVGNACTSCHTLHTTEDAVQAKDTQTDTCFKCHTKQRADSYKLSHHPVREGKVACADCHSVHGSPGEKLLKEVRLNDTCYNCHAEKRGPFLFEHEPVRDNCDTCHAPHGSNVERLLKSRMPNLCSDCHGNSGIAGSGTPTGASAIVAGVNPVTGAAVTGSTHPQQARQCMYCHSQIHGSNNPAGQAFYR